MKDAGMSPLVEARYEAKGMCGQDWNFPLGAGRGARRDIEYDIQQAATLAMFGSLMQLYRAQRSWAPFQ